MTEVMARKESGLEKERHLAAIICLFKDGDSLKQECITGEELVKFSQLIDGFLRIERKLLEKSTQDVIPIDSVCQTLPELLLSFRKKKDKENAKDVPINKQ